MSLPRFLRMARPPPTPPGPTLGRRLHEPDRAAARLVARVGAGEDAVEVREDGTVRWLQFGRGAIQSLMHLRDPGSLVLPYTRALLCWLLFREDPRDVLMLGLGGGTLVRWLLACRPDCRLTVVEADARVVELAHTWFRIPEREPRLRIEVDDAQAALHRLPGDRDLLLVDVFEADGMPAWIDELALYEAAAASLAPGGVLCANLWARDAGTFKRLLARAREAFDGRTLCLPIPGYHNVVLLAFTAPPEDLDLASLERRAAGQEARYHIEMTQFLARIAETNPVHEGRLVV